MKGDFSAIDLICQLVVAAKEPPLHADPMARRCVDLCQDHAGIARTFEDHRSLELQHIPNLAGVKSCHLSESTMLPRSPSSVPRGVSTSAYSSFSQAVLLTLAWKQDDYRPSTGE